MGDAYERFKRQLAAEVVAKGLAHRVAIEELGTHHGFALAVQQGLRGALEHISPDRLIAAPDCGMKYLPREVAFGKLKAMVDGAAMVRRELG